MASAAASRFGTGRQSSPGSGLQGRRVNRTRGTPRRAQAAAAWAEIRTAKGWVASMTASIDLAARNLANPSTPPNPPVRTGIGAGAGRAVRPASDSSGATSG